MSMTQKSRHLLPALMKKHEQIERSIENRAAIMLCIVQKV